MIERTIMKQTLTEHLPSSGYLFCVTPNKTLNKDLSASSLGGRGNYSENTNGMGKMRQVRLNKP